MYNSAHLLASTLILPSIDARSVTLIVPLESSRLNAWEHFITYSQAGSTSFASSILLASPSYRSNNFRSVWTSASSKLYLENCFSTSSCISPYVLPPPHSISYPKLFLPIFSLPLFPFFAGTFLVVFSFTTTVLSGVVVFDFFGICQQYEYKKEFWVLTNRIF